ncbi:MAG TPA: (deoxy)nucleoside triphosphate pyrophosphohydrolase [Verrucomicrobiae bacterium]|nr:(deoxy)nucleoside triphosphate pyrophosphohydrolase [Verrucomicrobiae bacterium]
MSNAAENESSSDSAQASEEPGRIIEVAAGLVFRNGLLLITQRRQEDHLGGLWEFPGGKRHREESFEECLKRELREELDIEVEVKELVESITHTYPKKTVHLKFFRCAWLRNEPRAAGCQNFAWVASDQLGGYAFPAADQRLLKMLVTTSEVWR